MSKSIDSAGRTGTFLLFLWFGMVLVLWGFAFVPAPEHSPEWVLQTQAVCFGTLSNGLPAPHGWMLLILSPLALLSAIWVSHAKEISHSIRYIRNSYFFKGVLLIFIGFLMWEAHWVGKRVTYAVRLARLGMQATVKNPLPVDYLRTNTLVPAFSLVNQFGESINQEVFRGRVTILTFAFAHCSNICPMLIKDSVDAQKRISSRDVQTVVISIDPWRDTPGNLGSLAKTWSLQPGSHLLSGQPETLVEILKEFKVATARNLKNGEINHAGQIMVVDRKGRVAYSFLNPSVDWIVTAAGRLLRE